MSERGRGKGGRILVVGLTPAWQHILTFEALRRGEVNRAAEAVWCASGKAVNVATALAQLKADCGLISPLGQNVYESVAAQLRQLGLEPRLVRTQSPTRVCTTLIESEGGSVTELVENAQPLEAAVIQGVTELYLAEVERAQVAVLTGSLPAGTPTHFYRDLVAATSARVVLDGRGPELLAALEARPFLVKPNREELAATCNAPLDDDAALIAAMHGLNRRGAEWVVVTQGTRAVWATSSDDAFRLPPLAVKKVVNPIGCGDALAAGVAWGLAGGAQPLESISLGLACAAQNAEQLLPGRIDPARARADARQVAIERVALS